MKIPFYLSSKTFKTNKNQLEFFKDGCHPLNMVNGQASGFALSGSRQPIAHENAIAPIAGEIEVPTNTIRVCSNGVLSTGKLTAIGDGKALISADNYGGRIFVEEFGYIGFDFEINNVVIKPSETWINRYLGNEKRQDYRELRSLWVSDEREVQVFKQAPYLSAGETVYDLISVCPVKDDRRPVFVNNISATIKASEFTVVRGSLDAFDFCLRNAYDEAVLKQTGEAVEPGTDQDEESDLHLSAPR